MTTAPDTPALDSLAAKRWDNGGEFGALLQPDHQYTISATPAAIAGGEAPTEAEFLALRTLVDNIRTGLITIGAFKSA